MIALARIQPEPDGRWIITADQRSWIYLEEFADDVTTLPQAIAAFKRLPQVWPLLRRGHTINPRHLMAPAVSPGKVIGIAANYDEHATEVGLPASADLRLFAKFPSAITGPTSRITADARVTGELDYEAELAVIIGEHVPVGRAPRDPMDAVFGYAVANDVSARDIQRAGNQLTYAKSLDTFLPMGPWITLQAETTTPLAERTITTLINGQVRQSALLGQMIRDVPTLIRDITRSISLDPGDIILTGSPGGTGMGQVPPRFLADEDIVTCRITGLGYISNTVQITHRLSSVPRAEEPVTPR